MSQNKTTVINATYHDVYTGREPIMFRSITELSGSRLGVKVVFESNMSDVTGFAASVDKKPYKESKTGSTTLVFEDTDQRQEKVVSVKALFGNDQSSSVRQISFFCCSTKFYAAQKMSNHPTYITAVSIPSIPLATGAPEDFIKLPPIPSEICFAEKQWGHCIHKNKSGYENAVSLAKAIMPDLWQHAGFPSDAMNDLRPLQQYERMMSGKDLGNCGIFSPVFASACNALGIPARVLNKSEILSSSDKMNIQIGSSHVTMEIFDNETNQWIWFDVQYYSLGAFLGKEGPLNTIEFHLFLQHPQRRKRLRLRIYDINTKTEKMLPIKKCPYRWDCFEGASASYNYV